MKKLEPNLLSNSDIGLSPRYGGFLWEAAAICLNKRGHGSTVNLSGEGHFPEVYEVSCEALHERAADSWSDLQEATEYGATGIALAVLFTETGMKMKRAYKGTGIDYWGGVINQGFPFQEKARIEISGILSGTQNQIDTRLRQKLDQTAATSYTGLPAYAAVVEFGNPKILIGQR